MQDIGLFPIATATVNAAKEKPAHLAMHGLSNAGAPIWGTLVAGAGFEPATFRL
jgi:hypothetical protein